MIEEFAPKGRGYSGVPPNDWRILPMGDACSKVTDGTHDTPKTLDRGFPYITAIHVKNGKIDFEKCSYLSAEDHAAVFKRCNPERGDLTVVNIGAGVAECGAVDVDFEFSMKNVALLKPKADILDHKYLLQSHLHRKDRIAHAIKSGGAQPFMSLAEIRKLPIAVPPILEQRRIAEILSTWDRAIETTEKLITNSEAQKKALMQQLLTGKKRLPGFGGEWEMQNLDDLFDLRTGKSKSSSISENGKYKIVDMGAIDRQSRLCAQKKIAERVDPLSKGDLVMPKDDIGGGQIIGRVALIPNDDDYELGDHVFVLRPQRNNIDPKFFYYQINYPGVRKNLRRKANGTAQLGLSGRDVKMQTLALPDIGEQLAIAGLLKAADDKIDVLIAKLKILTSEKSALMQHLLTGKRRVAIDQEQAA